MKNIKLNVIKIAPPPKSKTMLLRKEYFPPKPFFQKIKTEIKVMKRRNSPGIISQNDQVISASKFPRANKSSAKSGFNNSIFFPTKGKTIKILEIKIPKNSNAIIILECSFFSS